MAVRFHRQLVNDPFGDPGLYVESMSEKRAILFDLSDLTPLSTRKLLRLTDVFISHMHMDHFCGLDRLVRLFLGRERTLRLYGPEGLIEAVGLPLGRLRREVATLTEGARIAYVGDTAFTPVSVTPFAVTG